MTEQDVIDMTERDVLDSLSFTLRNPNPFSKAFFPRQCTPDSRQRDYDIAVLIRVMAMAARYPSYPCEGWPVDFERCMCEPCSSNRVRGYATGTLVFAAFKAYIDKYPQATPDALDTTLSTYLDSATVTGRPLVQGYVPNL